MDETLQPISLPPLGRGARERSLASPFQFYMRPNDRLRITSYNSQTGVRLDLQGRLVASDGTVKPFSRSHIPNTDRSAKSEDFPIGDCVITNLVVFAGAGAPLVGQTFIKLQVVQGDAVNAPALGTMLQGYVTANSELAWPGSPIQSSLEGGGYTRTFNGTAPAPFSAWFETCPTNAQWEVLSCWTQFHADATVATRYMHMLSFSPTVNNLTFIPFLTGIAAGETWVLQGFQGANYVALAPLFMQNAPLPKRFRLRAGERIGMTGLNFQPADFFDAPVIQVREWIVP